MTDIAGTLGSMFSLIIVTILGYVAARCGFISADIRPKLSGLIFNITLPCTILASVGKIDASTGAEAITWSLVFGIALFFVMLAGGALACLALRVPRGERGLYLWMGVLTNTGFIGFAVLDSIFGGASVFWAASLSRCPTSLSTASAWRCCARRARRGAPRVLVAKEPRVRPHESATAPSMCAACSKTWSTCRW